MIEIADKLFVGTVGEIGATDDEFKIVNVAHTYHYALHQWRLKEDHKSDPCYVVHEDPRMLSINWIDSQARFFDYNGEGVKTFHKILNFIQKFRGPFKVLIACNKGESRAPSVGLVYLAKRTDVLLAKDEQFEYSIPYVLSRGRFMTLYPNYLPGAGMTDFLINHWEEL
jgi:hypothetical protein